MFIIVRWCRVISWLINMKRDEDWTKGIAKIEIFINGEWVDVCSLVNPDTGITGDSEPLEIENLINGLDLDFGESGLSGIDITWR